MKVLRNFLKVISWRLVLWLFAITLVIVLFIVYQDREAKKLLIKNRTNLFITDIGGLSKHKVIVSDPAIASTKEYRLDADVNVDVCGIDIDENHCYNKVTVEKIYWPDRGVSTFDDCTLNHMGVGDPIQCTASNGEPKNYDIELIW